MKALAAIEEQLAGEALAGRSSGKMAVGKIGIHLSKK